MRDLRRRLNPLLRSHFSMILALVVVLSMFVAALGGLAGIALTPTGVPATGVVPLHSHSAPRPVPFPPVHVHPLGITRPNAVDPTGRYSAEPAPMGIGDFGVGKGGNAYSYNTSEFLGNFSWQTLNLSQAGDTQFSDQLNVVLQFVQNGVTYAYWIQDVAFMDSASNDLSFENNIWNMTTNSLCLNNTGVRGNGTVYSLSGCEGYYAVSPTTQPGASLVMPNPGDFGLLVRAYHTGSGVPEVAFEYWDGVTSYYVTYDNVVWPWATAVSSDTGFLVDGSAYNPGGWFYDAELTVGGPGNSLATTAQDPTHVTSRLLYWNGHNFEAPPSVWNFGANTAEAVSNIQSIFASDRAGLPLTLQLNGTTRNASPDRAYDQGRVGELAIAAPGISQGTVAIPGDTWTFVGDSANLTLVPGTYRVWVNSTSGTNDLGECTVVAGVTSEASVAGGCGPQVSTPTASASGADIGQTVTFHATLLVAGSGGDTYVWHTSPTGLGCTSSTTLTLSCTPTAAGSYTVNVTATDSSSRSSTSGTLRFVVSSDPTVGTPSPSRTTAETGASVSFSVSPTGGAPPYSYSWSGLPTPCGQVATSMPDCAPANVGSYTITVSVTDANGFEVTSLGLTFTVTAGPSIGPLSATPPASIDLGQSVKFSTTATGGSGGYTFTWSGLPPGCAVTVASNLTCFPSAAGGFAIVVSVADSAGGSATSGPLDFTVHNELSTGELGVAPTSIDLGQTMRFALNGGPTGGAGSYSYVWTGLPQGCVTDDSPTLTCVPSQAPDAGYARVTVHDADSGTNATSAAWRVFADLSLPALWESRTVIDVGQPVQFSAMFLQGGVPPIIYRWSGLPVGCAPSDTVGILCNPTAVGTTEVSVNITDLNGYTAEGSLGFTVLADPTAGTPTATPGSVQPGHSVTFTTTASGGSGGYSYNWTGLPTGCMPLNASRVTCQPTSTGTFGVAVNVTDSNGYTVSSEVLEFSVTAAPDQFLGLPALEGYSLVGVAAGLVVVGLVVAAAMRSRRWRGPPTG